MSRCLQYYSDEPCTIAIQKGPPHTPHTASLVSSSICGVCTHLSIYLFTGFSVLPKYMQALYIYMHNFVCCVYVHFTHDTWVHLTSPNQ